MLLLSSPSESVSGSEPGTIYACAVEAASVLIWLQASSAARAVVGASTEFVFSSVSGAGNFVSDVRGSDAANAASDATISTLHTRQNGAHPKGYTTDCAHPD